MLDRTDRTLTAKATPCTGLTEQSPELRVGLCESKLIHETIPYSDGFIPEGPDSVPGCFNYWQISCLLIPEIVMYFLIKRKYKTH